jgi:hypothetical protein
MDSGRIVNGVMKYVKERREYKWGSETSRQASRLVFMEWTDD